MSEAIRFLRRYFRAPGVTGAVAPSSRFLARRMVEPLRERVDPSRILEVGAGTGAFTRVIGSVMSSSDRLDVCEIQPEFADVLERRVLTEEPLAAARREGRVRLIRGAVQSLEARATYDVVICGLPFTAFEAEQVREIIEVIAGSLKPGGTFSYFEYIGIRRIVERFAPSGQRRRVRAVSVLLDELIARHQVRCRRVWFNLPPASARHWQFA